MARVPRISYDNTGNLLAIRAILEGGRARQRGYEAQGALIGGALTRAGESIGMGMREKKDRAERAGVRRDIAAERSADRQERQADREEGRRIQKANFSLARIKADGAILADQKDAADKEVRALTQHLGLHPELAEDENFKSRYKAAMGRSTAATEGTEALSGRFAAVERALYSEQPSIFNPLPNR